MLFDNVKFFGFVNAEFAKWELEWWDIKEVFIFQQCTFTNSILIAHSAAVI